MATLSVPRPGKDAVQTRPREFSLYSQAGPQNGSVPLEPLQKLAKEYGSEEKIPEKEASFEALASCLRRKPTHTPAEEGNCLAFAARDTSGHLSAWRFDRPELREDEIRLQIAYCGICHSDLHKVKDEWGGSQFPIVPGHEIVGVVTEVGSAVKGFSVGERAAVGCMVNSCRSCKNCKRGLEQYCPGVVWTYDSKSPTDGALTRGGYSTWLTCSQDFLLHLPTNLPMDAAAPLLCAGITTYSPMRHFGMDKPGLKIGVVGLGGLGHMAVKFGKAFGCEVTVISTSPSKKEEAVERLGADHFLVSKDEEEMAKHAGSLAGIIDTVSAQHDLGPLLSLLDTDGQLVMVGLPPEPLAVRPFSLAQGRKAVAGSNIGGIAETQEMLDFCGEHNITCDIELVSIDYVNEAMSRLVKNDVRYRFVIDIQGSLVQE